MQNNTNNHAFLSTTGQGSSYLESNKGRPAEAVCQTTQASLPQHTGVGKDPAVESPQDSDYMEVEEEGVAPSQKQQLIKVKKNESSMVSQPNSPTFVKRTERVAMADRSLHFFDFVYCSRVSHHGFN